MEGATGADSRPGRPLLPGAGPVEDVFHLFGAGQPFAGEKGSGHFCAGEKGNVPFYGDETCSA